MIVVTLPLTALLIAVAVRSMSRAGRTRRIRDRRSEHVVEVCEQLAGDLGAGVPPGQALQAATETWPEFTGVAHAEVMGASVPVALRRLASEPGAAALDLLAAGWQTAQELGHSLTEITGAVAEEVRASADQARLVAGELASARATARIVVLLPVVALLLGRGVGGSPVHFLFATPWGAGALGMGLTLQWWGLRWIERLTTTAEGSASVHRDASHQQIPMHERHPWVVVTGAGVLFALFIGGFIGVVLGGAVTFGGRRLLRRLPTSAVRERRAEVTRTMPALVRLASAALISGASVERAMGAACRALPGAAAEVVDEAVSRMEMGMPPPMAWGALATHDASARMGRALARAEESGASVAATLTRVADDLTRRRRAEEIERARGVGVRAALPLGLCLLPGFVLVGVVPMVGGLLTTLNP